MKTKKIAIIGGGPTGLYLAYLLSKAKLDVCVFEEHKTVGLPVQCTGIVTGNIDQFSDLRLAIKNSKLLSIKDVEVFAPNKEFVPIKLKKSNIILDRAKFDQEIYKLAKKQGADIRLHTKVINIYKKRIESLKNGNKTPNLENFDYIIGADGPNSMVSNMIDIQKKKEYWVGVQARVRLKNNLKVQFYPFYGTYAWVVPESKTIARVGVVCEKDVSKKFSVFLKKFTTKANIISYQGGSIPKYDSFLKYSKNGYYLIGDAAHFVKATTGGGIIPGLISARLLSKSIIENKSYKSLVLRKLMPNLLIHKLIRNRLDRFTKKDYNELIRLVKTNKIKHIIEKHDREYPIRLLFSILIKKPSILRFLFK